MMLKRIYLATIGILLMTSEVKSTQCYSMESDPSPQKIKKFHETLRVRELGKAECYLQQYPSLISSLNPENGAPAVISAIQMHPYHGDGLKVLEFLSNYNVNFNALFPQQVEMPCDLNPIAYSIWRDVYSCPPLIQFLMDKGTIIDHLSIQIAIEEKYKSKYIDHSIMGYRFELDKVCAILGIAPPERPFLFNDIGSFTIKAFQGFENEFIYGNKGEKTKLIMPFDRVRPYEVDYCIAGIKITRETMHKEKNTILNVFVGRVNGIESISKTRQKYKFYNQAIGLVFDIITGKHSPKELYDYLSSLYGSGFQNTNLGDFLQLSPGFSDYLSQDRKVVVSHNLISYLCQETKDYINESGQEESHLIRAQKFFDPYRVKYPLSIKTGLFSNGGDIPVSISGRGGSKCPIFISRVETYKDKNQKHILSLEAEIFNYSDDQVQCVTLNDLKKKGIDSSKHQFVFEGSLSQSIILSMISGQESPAIIKKALETYLGRQLDQMNTSLICFLDLLPGYEGFRYDGKKAVVSTDILSILWGGTFSAIL